jgi:hypothetical protein
MAGFRCSRCGEWHEEVPQAWHFPAPDHVNAIPEEERAERVLLGDDQCVIDNEDFFLRCLVVLPISEAGDEFHWGVWVAVSPADYARYALLWETRGRERNAPFSGLIVNGLPGYPRTFELPVSVEIQPVPNRPRLIIEAEDHPLAVEQRQGITMARVEAIAADVMHDE